MEGGDENFSRALEDDAALSELAVDRFPGLSAQKRVRQC